MLFQVLDVDYVFTGGKPLVRLFGKTERGNAACLFYDKFFPYFYVRPREQITLPTTIREIKTVEQVKRFLPLGYQREQTDLLKVTLFNPQDVPIVKERLLKEGIAAEAFESDILFKYRFLVDFGITGMSWIDVDAEKVISKTVKVQPYTVRSFNTQTPRAEANLSTLSLDIECLPTDPNKPLDPKNNVIIMISLTFIPAFRNRQTLVLLAKPASGKDVKGCSSEKEMLMEFCSVMDAYDPDIVTGYNINAFDLPFILERLRHHKLPLSLGRAVDKVAFVKTFGMSAHGTIPGRVVVDPYQILRRDPWLKLHRYDLKTVARTLLGQEKGDVAYNEMERLWDSNGEELSRFIEYSRKDSQLNMQLVIEKGLLDKFFEVCRITGVLLQDTFGGQTQRIETMLLHDFRRKKFVMPSKSFSGPFRETKNHSDLKGAAVLEPTKGLHTEGCVLVLDFKSLYPSIMRTYNISPDTLLTTGDEASTQAPNGARFVTDAVRHGIFPDLLQKLLEARREAKKAMKEADGEHKRILNARQLARKDISNSFYGYTGYARARLFMLDVANAITAHGRLNIEKTKKLVEEQFKTDVVYGDTDSIFVKTQTTNLDEAKELGDRISTFVTKELGGYLELEFEKIYRTFLILTKKRYVGWAFRKEDENWKDTIEMKGIETVRRDWCPLVSETMREVINIILKDGDVKRAMKTVRHVVDEIRQGKIDLDKLTIIKGITKHPDSYDGMLPHIELARKLSRRNPQEAPKIGDRIGFVIVRGNQMLSKRAEDPAYVKKHNLAIDSDYYIQAQLLPPVERIFASLNVSKDELVGLGRQTSLGDIVNGTKPHTKRDIPLSFTDTKLDDWEEFVCASCHMTYRSMPLRGSCKACGGELQIGNHGSVGKTVYLSGKRP